MSALHRFCALLVMAALALAATSCSRTPKWFLGTYEFDASQSLKPLLDQPEKLKDKNSKEDGAVFNVLKGMATVLAPVALINKYEGVTLTIKDGEMITMKGGNGTVIQYEVYQIPDANTVMIKTSENEIVTWTRTETGIAQKASGELDVVIPFKRKAP